MAHDLRFAIRQMLKNPGFTVPAILTLALAIGANTAIFSAVDALILHPLPYRNPEQLVKIGESIRKYNLVKIPVAPAELADLQKMSHSFSQVGGILSGDFTLTGQGTAEAVSGLRISANVFTIFDAQPIAGGLFTGQDEEQGKHQVVVLSEGSWRRRFGGDPKIVGASIEINRERYRVAGVVRAILEYRGTAWDIWVPLSFRPDELAVTTRGGKSVDVVARLKPGVTLAQANADLALVTSALLAQYPDVFSKDAGVSIEVEPLSVSVSGDLRKPMLLLLAAVGALMLIACANVSNLLLARAVARRKEMSIRAALGAARTRMIRQLLSESVMLAVLAGALGLALAFSLLHLYQASGPKDLIRNASLELNGWVVVFTFGLSAAASILFGLAPSLTAVRVDLNEVLKETSRGGTTSRRRLREALVALEIAVSLVLLICAGLLMRSFARVQQASPGFQTHNVLTFDLILPVSQYREDAKRDAFYGSLLARLRALPGVVSAGAIDRVPFGGRMGGSPLRVVGRPPQNTGAPEPMVRPARSTPGYFESMGIPLRRGRYFTSEDIRDRSAAAIIDEAAARRYFPNNEDPIGRRIFGVEPNLTATIVGVVGTVKRGDLAEIPEMTVYHAAMQRSGNYMSFIVKTAADPLAILPAVRREVAAVDSALPLARTTTMDQRIAESLARRRLSLQLMGAFAGFSGLLAAIGIYGVLSYVVDQRRRELAIRMALGAPASRVVGLVTAQGAIPVLAGVGAGLAGAIGATRLLQSMLYEFSPGDPIVMTGVAALLTLIALIAIAVPARRASRIDPIIALREE